MTTSIDRVLKTRSCSSGSLTRSSQRRVALPEVLVVARQRRRLELLPDELVDRGQQQPLVAGELLRVLRAAAGEDDRHQIVGAEVALDELTRGDLARAASAARDVQVVEDHHVDAAVERPLVALTSGSIGLAANSGRSARSIGMSTSGERRNRLALAVLEDLKVVLGQVADELALLVGDERVDLDVFDLRLERRGLRCWRLRRLPRGEHNAAAAQQRTARRIGTRRFIKFPPVSAIIPSGDSRRTPVWKRSRRTGSATVYT